MDIRDDFLKSFNPNSKVWIFQSIDYLNESHVSFIYKKISEFIKSWNSHGKNLKGDVIILKSHFIFVIIDGDLNEASGCSIDKLFKKIKDVGENLEKDFLNRNFIGFKYNLKEKSKINFLLIQDFKKKVINNFFSEDIVIFDNSISKLNQLQNWCLNLDRWKERYIK